MKFLLIILTFISSSFAVDNIKKIHINALNEDVSLDKLSGRYNKHPYETPRKNTFPPPRLRNEMFRDSGLSIYINKYDEVDKDILFMTVHKQTLDDVLRKFPKLSNRKTQLKKLKVISGKTPW